MATLDKQKGIVNNPLLVKEDLQEGGVDDKQGEQGGDGVNGTGMCSLCCVCGVFCVCVC